MKHDSELPYKKLIKILTDLTSASWRSIGAHANSLQKENKQEKVSTVDLFLLALSSIKEGDKFIKKTSLLAKRDINTALRLSLAGAHLSICLEKVWMGQRDQAVDDAQAFVQLAIASAQSIGFDIPDSQMAIFLERARSLPARIECQQSLSLAKSLGHIPGKLLFVLGTHRSGTSALTGLLKELGAGLPTDLMPPEPDNPKGYWESVSIASANDLLLSKYGSSWRMNTVLPLDWTDLPPAIEWRQQLLTSLQQESGAADFVVIKDPRFCNLIRGLSYWLEDGSVDFSFALLIRHPFEVVNSLLSRQNFPINKDESFLLWIKSVLESERSTRSFSRIILIADDLFESPITVESELRNLLKNEPVAASDHEAFRFIDPTLRHHHGFNKRVSMPGVDTIRCEAMEDLALKIYYEFKATRTKLNTETLDHFYLVFQDLLYT